MEHVVYHIHNPQAPAPRPSKLASILNKISKFFLFLGLALIFLAYLPSLVFWIEGTFFGSKDNFKLTQTEVETLADASKETGYLPAYDPKLPREARLTIPAIGVDTPIQEATYDNYEEALKKGVWRVSDFGAPGEAGVPVILAAHRYGYLSWTNTFRRLNSFYNLPKLKVGDVVEIVWRQRKFTYEIYAESKGEEITDYGADLILYTCETLNGPVRIFRYARLLKI